MAVSWGGARRGWGGTGAGAGGGWASPDSVSLSLSLSLANSVASYENEGASGTLVPWMGVAGA